MKNKVIHEIHEELNKFEATDNQKHIYVIEKLLLILKEDQTPALKKETPTKEKHKSKTKRSLDGLYLAEDKSNSIFDF